MASVEVHYSLQAFVLLYLKGEEIVISRQSPMLSIIVPVYNAERYVRKCVQSIISQSFSDFEVILVNDGSTDKSWDLLLELAKSDARLRLVNQANGGVSAARNKGIELSQGTFIGFVDSDDYVAPCMFEYLLKGLTDYGADISECGYAVVDARGNAILERPLVNAVTMGSVECSREYLLNINSTNFSCNKVYAAHILKILRFPNLKYSEDYVLNATAFIRCAKKVTISGCYYYYYRNSDSATSAPYSRTKLDILRAGELVHKLLEERQPNLRHLSAAYVLDYCIYLYGKVQSGGDHCSREDRKLILSAFAQYYSLAMVYKRAGAFGCRMEFSRAVFRLSPTLYQILSRFPKLIVKRF